MKLRRLCLGVAISMAALIGPLLAQEYAGPLLPHVGGKVTTAFSNTFGPDAESTLTFTEIAPDSLSVTYESTRGLTVYRKTLMQDRANARTYVLGYAAKMPSVIPNTTSLGVSGAVLEELRNTGKTALTLAYDADLAAIPGQLTLVEKMIKVPILIEDQVVQVAAIRAKGTFAGAGKTGTGEFLFLDNKNNPMMLESKIQFSWEKQPRNERITRVTAGQSMRSAMEQSLNTLRRYDLYGIHFDFDKATIRPDAASLIADIALTLKNNPTWTLQINGHTDSIGKPEYNQKLSADRAAAVANAIAKQGINPARLASGGFGSTQPKGDNTTLEGRALNRRVELLRTDK